MKPSIFVTQPLPQAGLDKLNEYFSVTINKLDTPLTKPELIHKIHNQDALLCLLNDTIDKEVIEAGNQLKVISNFAVGYNNIDIQAAKKQNISVCITPGILTDATADLAFALILAITRRIVEADHYTRQGLFKGFGATLFLGNDLSQKTLGIIGMGRIGIAVATRAKAFGMNIIYYSRTEKTSKETEALNAKPVSLATLLETADVISLHCPLTPETHHLIGAAEFKKMKKTAYLINTARGPIIDEQALLKALQEQRIAGAGLDVYEQEPLITPGLEKLSNVVLLPHIGSATIETRTQMAVIAAENAIAVLEGKKPHAVVNI